MRYFKEMRLGSLLLCGGKGVLEVRGEREKEMRLDCEVGVADRSLGASLKS